MRNIIYIVHQDGGYEAGIDICAFLDKAAAAEFVEELNAYNNQYTQCPTDANVSDKDWEKWERKNKKWQRNHPARIYYAECLVAYNDFVVHTLDLVGPDIEPPKDQP